ncbi:hypothetical protein [Mycetohabitans sp. B46]|uniref:hypothetical protein n=1 Tax=Mycetohabitans sp. B46 TaxID=2772536 RepID=UPI00307EF972
MLDATFIGKAVMMLALLIAMLRATDAWASAGFAPIAIGQQWSFWGAPLLGAVIARLFYPGRDTAASER